MYNYTNQPPADKIELYKNLYRGAENGHMEALGQLVNLAFCQGEFNEYTIKAHILLIGMLDHKDCLIQQSAYEEIGKIQRFLLAKIATEYSDIQNDFTNVTKGSYAYECLKIASTISDALEMRRFVSERTQQLVAKIV